MVVDNRHTVAGCQDALILNVLGSVCIDNYKQRSAVSAHNRLLRRDEGIPVILKALQPCYKRARAVICLVNNDAVFSSELAGYAANAGGSANAVHIAEFMTHHKNMLGAFHQLGKRVCHNAGFDLGARFNLLAASAEELKAEAVFDNRLVSAARERHFRTERREAIAFLKVFSVSAYSYADRSVDSGRAYHLMHTVKQRELILGKLGIVAPLKNKKVSVSVVAAEHTAFIRAPMLNAVKHHVFKLVSHALGLVFGYFVEIVENYNGNDGTGVFIFLLCAVIVCNIQPVADAHKVRARFILAANYVAVNAKTSVPDINKAGILQLALGKPFGLKFGYKVCQPQVKARSAAENIKEKLISPNERRVFQLKGNHRQRKVDQGVVFRRFNVIGHRLDVFHEFLAAAASCYHIINQH